MIYIPYTWYLQDFGCALSFVGCERLGIFKNAVYWLTSIMIEPGAFLIAVGLPLQGAFIATAIIYAYIDLGKIPDD